MRGNKRYTNVTFTKRVDHEEKPDKSKSLSEPAVCSECQAVYFRRRWHSSSQLNGDDKALQEKVKMTTICPACDQILRKDAKGLLSLDGDFVSKHAVDIENLLRNEAARSAEDNPTARIMELSKTVGKGIQVKTTTDHLAHRLGHAIEKAYDGELHISFSHENHLTRVSWHRD